MVFFRNMYSPFQRKGECCFWCRSKNSRGALQGIKFIRSSSALQKRSSRYIPEQSDSVHVCRWWCCSGSSSFLCTYCAFFGFFFCFCDFFFSFIISMVKILTFIMILPRGNGTSLCRKWEIIQERKKKFGAARFLQPIQKITLRFLYKMTACQNKFLLTVFAAYVIMQVQPTDKFERMKVHEK